MGLVTKKWMLPVCRRCCSGSIPVQVAPAQIFVRIGKVRYYGKIT